MVDAKVYHELGERIADGDGYPYPVFSTNPFYPYLLGFFFRLFGPDVMPVALFQILLGLAGTFLLFRIAARLGGYHAGILALLIGGLYRPAIVYETFLLPTTIGIFINLLLLSILVLREPGDPLKRLIPAGLLLGLGTLVQGNLLLFLPFIIVWLFIREPVNKRAGAIGIFLAGTFLVILPVTLRNGIRGGDCVLISSHAGVNFYMGNHDSATGVFSFGDGAVHTPENINLYESKRIAEEKLGTGLKPSEISSYWMRRGLGWIREEPGEYIILLGRKAVLFWNDMEIPDNVDMNFFQERLPILRSAPFLFGITAPFGVLGLFALAGRRRGTVLLLFLAAQFLSALIFYTHSRYRMPFAVVLTIPAAVGVLTMARGVRRWGLPRMIWTVASVAVLFVLINYDLMGSARARIRGYSLTHLANGLLESGETEEAEHAYRSALELLPGHPTALYGFARLCQMDERYREALAAYRAAAHVSPDFVEVRMNLGVVYHTLGENEEAVEEYREALRLRPDHASTHYNLGNALFDLDRFEEAAEEYRRAGELEPGDRLAARNLVNTLEAMGDLEGAVNEVRDQLAAGDDADLRNRLGDILEKQEDEEGAMTQYRRAVELNPRHSAALCNIGLLQYHNGQNRRAIETWRRILEYDPESGIVRNIKLAEEAMRLDREREVGDR